MIGTLLCLSFLGGPGQPAEKPGLDEAVRAYFLAKSAEQRQAAEKRILATPGITAQKLEAAIRRAKLWRKQPVGVYELSVRLRGAEAAELAVWVSVPKNYDPARRWPLLIALHGANGRAEEMLRTAREALGELAEQFIIAAPQDIGRLGLTQPVDLVARPRELVCSLRRQFHLDNDRVFLLGYSLGSHNAWVTAIMHADLFAGLIALASPLQVVAGDTLYEELLQNVRHVAVLFCWGAQDTLGRDGQPDPGGGNAAGNRRMTAVINALGFRHFEAVEIADAGHEGIKPPPDRLAALLGFRRERLPSRVRHVFRLPDQSDAYWVSTDRLLGEPLPDGRLRIPIAAGEDPRAAERKWLIGRLGMIEAQCQGQTLRLNARRCGHVTVLISEQMLDLREPVTVFRNKKKLYEGLIQPDLRVMLTEAAKTWDFERLYVARLVVPIGGKVKFGYPPLPGRASTADPSRPEAAGKSAAKKPSQR